jgi:hypothetical protein
MHPTVARHPEARALASLEGRRTEVIEYAPSFEARRKSASHLRMTAAGWL